MIIFYEEQINNHIDIQYVNPHSIIGIYLVKKKMSNLKLKIMKRMFVIAIALFSLGYIASAEVTVQRDAKSNVLVYQTDKVKISVEELPQAVQDVLNKDYKDWQVGDIYKVSGTNEYYSIELKKGSETKSLNLDKDGKEAKLEA